jgi:Fe-Mn family superoxide dismutase
MLNAGERVQIIDARPKHYATRGHEIMEGAVWRDPERVDEWIGELSKTDPVVAFCVYGFHVGCETAETLRKAGFDARYMAGVHYEWKAIKGPITLLAGNSPGRPAAAQAVACEAPPAQVGLE